MTHWGIHTYTNCTGGVRGDQPTEISRIDFDNAFKALLSELRPPKGEVFGANKIKEEFVVLVPVPMLKDIEFVLGFVTRDNLHKSITPTRNQYGRIGSFRIVPYLDGSYHRDHSNIASANGERVYTVRCVAVDKKGQELEEFLEDGKFKEGVVVELLATKTKEEPDKEE